MPHLNIQADVRRRLSEALRPVEVRVSVPDPRPPKLITVTREGGHRINDLIDGPGIGVYCWALTEAEAYELADQVDAVIRRLPFSGGYAAIDQESMRSDPDPDSHAPRWYLSYTITTFKHS